MWLVLTEPNDPSGAWLADGLEKSTGRTVVHLTSEEIYRASAAERRDGAYGAWFHLETANGRVVDSRNVRGIVNRIWALPPGVAMRMSLTHRERVVRNFTMPFMRWLHEFPGTVLNRPSAQGLSGDYRRDGEWSSFADRVGFMSSPERLPGEPLEDPARCIQVAVVGSQVVPLIAGRGAVSPLLADKCLRLAAAARANLLGIEAVRLWPRDWRFVNASLWPDLTGGGEKLLDAIAQALASPFSPDPARSASRPETSIGDAA